MALFVLLLRDSVSLLRFPLLSHGLVIPCASSRICLLKYSYSYFSSHFSRFCFAVYPEIDIAAISLSLLLIVYSSSVLFIYTFLKASKSSSSFFSWYKLSMSSFGWKVLCIVSNFLVLWSICLSSSLIHFKNGPGYLTRETTQVFIPFIRFPQQNFVSISFLIILRFSYFFHSSLFDCARLQIS